ncbi:MAG TPA: helix-turn-helix domain-containing protein [Caulobacteraceae bacterium]|nr:helix-turn-helix domain-containing protein [Caulobacteraceae bacterium]
MALVFRKFSERGEVTLDEAVTALGVSKTTVRRLIGGGVLPARQHCKGGPWIVTHADLEREEVRRQADARRSRSPAPDERQQDLPELSMA